MNRRYDLGAPQVETTRRDAAADWIELQSIITQLRNLPPADRRDPIAMEERYREQKIARQRLGRFGQVVDRP